MKSPIIMAFAAATTVFAAAGAANAQFPTTNLLTNPGAETGTLAGWTAVSTDGGTPPGVDNGSFDPGINPHTGTYDFYGGTEALGTLTQTVALVGNQGITAAEVNSGNLLANVSFWEQGLSQGTPSDDVSVTVNFFNGATMIGTDTTAEVDSHNSAWTQGTGAYAIPMGTTSIAYQVNFIRHVGSDNDSFDDDNSLIISQVGAAAAAPEPSSFALAGTALFGLAGTVIRRRRRAA